MCVEINNVAYYTCNLGPLQEQLAFLTAELSFQTCRSVNYTNFLKFLLFLYEPNFLFQRNRIWDLPWLPVCLFNACSKALLSVMVYIQQNKNSKLCEILQIPCPSLVHLTDVCGRPTVCHACASVLGFLPHKLISSGWHTFLSVKSNPKAEHHGYELVSIT